MTVPTVDLLSLSAAGLVTVTVGDGLELPPAVFLAGSAIILAALADRAFEEVPAHVHPVAVFGRFVAPVDRDWKTPRLIGLGAVIVLPTFAAVVAGGVVVTGGFLTASVGRTAASVSPLVLLTTTLAAATVLFVTSSQRMLVRVARDVVARSEADLAGAREAVPALAGRDPTPLSAGAVRSAAVESAAENLADGLVAPLFAFAITAGVVAQFLVDPVIVLGIAAAAAAWVKAVNTMDSMLGYHSKPVGWAPARLDDVVMWLPARLSALFLAVAARVPSALLAARADARVPESPNAGWPMATMARLLDCRLEKPRVYVLNPDAELPDTPRALRGIAIVDRAGWLAVVCLTVLPIGVSLLGTVISVSLLALSLSAGVMAMSEVFVL